jgi:hypothetical protein
VVAGSIAEPQTKWRRAQQRSHLSATAPDDFSQPDRIAVIAPVEELGDMITGAATAELEYTLEVCCNLGLRLTYHLKHKRALSPAPRE